MAVWQDVEQAEPEFAQRVLRVPRSARPTERSQLLAVVGHETHPARRRAPLWILLLTVLADALFFLSALGRLKRRYAELAEWPPTRRRSAPPGTPGSLRRRCSSSVRTVEGVVGIDPERGGHLLGREPRWELPPVAIVGALLRVVGLLML